jgi:hypothetical protein
MMPTYPTAVLRAAISAYAAMALAADRCEQVGDELGMLLAVSDVLDTFPDVLVVQVDSILLDILGPGLLPPEQALPAS